MQDAERHRVGFFPWLGFSERCRVLAEAAGGEAGPAASFDEIFDQAGVLLAGREDLSPVMGVSNLQMGGGHGWDGTPMTIAEVDEGTCERSLVARVHFMPWEGDRRARGCVCVSMAEACAVAIVETRSVTVLVRLDDRDAVVRLGLSHEAEGWARRSGDALSAVCIDGVDYTLSYVGGRRPSGIEVAGEGLAPGFRIGLAETVPFRETSRLLGRVLRREVDPGRLLDGGLRVFEGSGRLSSIAEITFLALSVVMREYLWKTDSSG